MQTFANAFLLAMFATFVAASSVNADTFTYSGGIVTDTISTTGTYLVTAAGAQGGKGVVPGTPFGAPGGLGALLRGDVFLTAGEVLDIAVGGQGSFFIEGSGGGGGSFVLAPGAVPLVVAGGGGGAAGFSDGQGGQTGAAGSGQGGASGDCDGGGGLALMEMARMESTKVLAQEAAEATIMPILSPAVRVLAEATGASEAEAARGFPKVVVQAVEEAVAIAAGLAGATMVAVAAPRISTRRSPIPVLPPAQTAATAM